MRIRFSILTMLVGAYMSAPYSVNGQLGESSDARGSPHKRWQSESFRTGAPRERQVRPLRNLAGGADAAGRTDGDVWRYRGAGGARGRSADI